jgi:HAD superfamily hydrolase (TIGR01509 family)
MLKIQRGSVDALLFDLGGVIMDIDFNRAFATWGRHAGCAPQLLATRFRADDVYERHERGECSAAEFFASLRTSLDIDISDAQFVEGWAEILVGEMPGVASLLVRAARHAPLYGFSNTNSAHVACFSPKFDSLLSHFQQIFYSYNIGHRKPDAEAYDVVIKAIGKPAGRIMFFDDLAENVDGASKRGLIAVQVRSPQCIADALDAIGFD